MSTDWERMSGAEITAALNRMLTTLREAHEAETIAGMEDQLAEAPVSPPFLSPHVAHPALGHHAAFVRSLMARGEHCVRLPGPLRRWLTDPEPDPTVMVDNTLVLDVRRCFGPAPYIGGEFFYVWQAAVDKHQRWIGGDEVAVARQ